MNVYLAGHNNKERIMQNVLLDENLQPFLDNINILESFYYICKNSKFMTLTKRFGLFLLDSGAFTFIQNAHKRAIDWDAYVEEYARFINRFDVAHFFELDIDSIVGLSEVERLRNKLENLTNKKCIPVWHKNRGKDYFIQMCKDYPYVALGGVVVKEIPRKLYESAFPWFIRTAHEHGAKIHGLGYTNVAGLAKYHFDSVDSSSWMHGNIGGFLYKFNPSTGLMKQIKVKNRRLRTQEGARHNFVEWVKFCAYANLNY